MYGGQTPTLQSEIQSYDSSTGRNINPASPWTTPGWDTGGQSSPHAQFEDWLQQSQPGVSANDFGYANGQPGQNIAGRPQATIGQTIATQGGLYGGNGANGVASPASGTAQNPFQPSYVSNLPQGQASTYNAALAPGYNPRGRPATTRPATTPPRSARVCSTTSATPIRASGHSSKPTSTITSSRTSK